MNILFCGGGTAGHVTPALAIADEIKERHPNAAIMFVGRENGDENRMIEKSGYTLETVNVSGIKRSLSIDNVKNIFTAIEAIGKSKKIIQNFSPDAVVGTGGYVCWPVIKAAAKMKIPTVIHESNACPGLVTKLLAPKCDKVLLNFSVAKNELKRCKNVKTVGNPIRREFLTLTKSAARKKLGISQKSFLIVSFGGSGGSMKINDAVISLMSSHSAKNKHIIHVHGCGNKYHTELKKDYPQFFKGKDGCIITPYIDDMPTLIRAADAVISRCGAMTISELSAFGVASILIPSPNVTNNHQLKNAKLISERKAAIMIEEKDLSERTLLDAVRLIENNATLREGMCRRIRAFFVEDSEKIIADEILSII